MLPGHRFEIRLPRHRRPIFVYEHVRTIGYHVGDVELTAFCVAGHLIATRSTSWGGTRWHIGPHMWEHGRWIEEDSLNQSTMYTSLRVLARGVPSNRWAHGHYNKMAARLATMRLEIIERTGQDPLRIPLLLVHTNAEFSLTTRFFSGRKPIRIDPWDHPVLEHAGVPLFRGGGFREPPLDKHWKPIVHAILEDPLAMPNHVIPYMTEVARRRRKRVTASEEPTDEAPESETPPEPPAAQEEPTDEAPESETPPEPPAAQEEPPSEPPVVEPHPPAPREAQEEPAREIPVVDTPPAPRAAEDGPIREPLAPAPRRAAPVSMVQFIDLPPGSRFVLEGLPNGGTRIRWRMATLQ